MASLRTTRRLTSMTPPPQPRDPYYALVPEFVTLSNEPEADAAPYANVGGGAKGLRRVKSSTVVRSSNYGPEYGHGHRTQHDSPDYTEHQVSNVDSRGRKKGKRVAAKSQPASLRDQDDVGEDNTPYTPVTPSQSSQRSAPLYNSPSTFLVPRPNTRSRSYSPSPIVSPPLPRALVDDESPSDASDNPSFSTPVKPKGSRRMSRPQSRETSEDMASQKAQRPSRLRAPTCRATPSLLPSTPTLNLSNEFLGSNNLVSGRIPSPAIQPTPTSSQPPHPSYSPSKSNARSFNTLHMSGLDLSCSPSMAVPRTLKDVTRRLERDRVLSSKESSQSESEPNPKFGFGLASASGHTLGQRPVDLVRPSLPSRRTTTVELSCRPSTPSTYFSKPTRHPTTSSLESTTKCSNQLSESSTTKKTINPSAVYTQTPRGSENISIRVPVTECVKGQSTRIIARERSKSRSPMPESVVEWELRQIPSDQEESSDNHSPAVPRHQTSSPAPIQSSFLPRRSNKPVHTRQQTSKTRTTKSPSIPSSLPTRINKSVSHKLSDSDASAYSLPRVKNLVICNPDPNDRPSPSSSSNPETPVSAAGAIAVSGDYSILALSSSQASMEDSVRDGNYIVPDEVAASLADDEQRRLKALAGLVRGLDLGAVNQEQQSTDDAARSRQIQYSQAASNTQRGFQHCTEADNGKEDDAFFSRLDVHNDDDSLLAEPEPEAGFKDNEEEFDEITSEESGEENIALPPTPKFVHPLEHGDDLASRITRMSSLGHISATPRALTSRRLEQDDRTQVRPELSEELVHAPNTETLWDPSRIPRQRLTEWATQIPGMSKGQQLDTQSEASRACNTHDSKSSKLNPQQETISDSQSQASNAVTDNELSAVSDRRLLDTGFSNEGTLSSGAEALFRNLQVEAEAREIDDSKKDHMIFNSHSDSETQALHYEELSNSQAKDQRPDYPNITVNSPEMNLLRTWRSTLPFGAYDSLAERHGPSEMRRQEVIWELCESEQVFVKSLRLVLRLFVQPLRHEDKTWISGVPHDVTRLFDWFDDIMHLHSQISSALHAARSAQYPVVIQIAETLRPFVPKLEIHQPYLVRLESVSAAVEAMSRDVHNDFGEFVRLQTASPECKSMNLPSFLLKPAQRLMKYPLFFKQLWELTPRNHPDHLPTFSLLHSTDMIIRVMQEVKAREEEYELVKNLASRIKSLPTGFQLARRERRLVAQGLLRRVTLSDKEHVMLDSSANTHEPCSPQGESISKVGSTSDSSSFAGDWSYHPAWPENMLASDLETSRSPHVESAASDGTLDSGSSMSRSTSGRSRASSLRGSLRHKSKESLVYAFVFTDLMILTTPISERLHLLRSPKHSSEGKESWKLIDDVGISRILGVTDQSGRLVNHPHLIAVELMSMAPECLDSGVPSNGVVAVPVHFGIPDQKPLSSNDTLDALDMAKAKWLDAFEQCFRFTLRSLSFPSYVRNAIASDGSVDLDSDTKSSVMSILASGLPLPMSPSQQLGEAQKGRPTDLVQGEREERGWWSLRFQQVLKEEQRSSRVLIFDSIPSRRNDVRGKLKNKRSETRPLILSPSTPDTQTRKSGLLSLGRKKSK